MSFGKNLQYLRRLSKNLTQEGLAEKIERQPSDSFKMGNRRSNARNGKSP